MIIPINEKYRLKSDINQWMIQKFSPTVKEPDNWKSIKYYTDPSNAVTELAQMSIRESDATTLAEALAEADRITTGLLTALAPVFQVQERLNKS